MRQYMFAYNSTQGWVGNKRRTHCAESFQVAAEHLQLLTQLWTKRRSEPTWTTPMGVYCCTPTPTLTSSHHTAAKASFSVRTTLQALGGSLVERRWWTGGRFQNWCPAGMQRRRWSLITYIHQWDRGRLSDKRPHNSHQLLKKAQQRLHFLRTLGKFGKSSKTLSNFTRCSVESIITSSFTVGCGDECWGQEGSAVS